MATVVVVVVTEPGTVGADMRHSVDTERWPTPPIEDLITVTGANEADPHVRESLGLYLLGALDGEERDAIERHLAGCPACCDEADELGTVADALALLPAPDVGQLIAESGLEEPGGTAPTEPGPMVPPEAQTRS